MLSKWSSITRGVRLRDAPPRSRAKRDQTVACIGHRRRRGAALASASLHAGDLSVGVREIGAHGNHPLVAFQAALAGVHDRCVSQFGEVLVDRHHSVSILFLGPESDLINGVRTMNSKGGGMSDGRHLRRRKSRVHETRASYLELAVQLAAVMQTDAGNMWTCKLMETPVRMAPCAQWHRLQL